jgi:hypothetical protein
MSSWTSSIGGTLGFFFLSYTPFSVHSSSFHTHSPTHLQYTLPLPSHAPAIAVRDVGKGPSMHKDRGLLERLHEGRHDGIFHKDLTVGQG